MLKNFERYNKFWGALIPIVVWFGQEYLGAPLTVEGVESWTNDLILILAPIYAYWMTNKTE